ncbi:hypothetical protein Golomagni_02394 [Golovinomyces magnicellulatus]|nr:hypothetical protein Golomagni_02394 [Golovinomyces magnicellulatus]
MSFLKAGEHLRNYFEGPGFQRKNITVISPYPEKPVSQCLQHLVIVSENYSVGLKSPFKQSTFYMTKL